MCSCVVESTVCYTFEVFPPDLYFVEVIGPSTVKVVSIKGRTAKGRSAERVTNLRDLEDRWLTVAEWITNLLVRLASVWVVLRLSEEPRANVGEIDLLGPTLPFICSVAEEDFLDEGHLRSVGVLALPAAVDDDSPIAAADGGVIVPRMLSGQQPLGSPELLIL